MVSEMLPRSGGRGRTKEAQAAREEAILQAILDLLSEGGYGAVTTDAIAARADVSKATIYRKWTTKSELLIAALGRVIQPIVVPDLGSFRAEVSYFLERRLEQYSKPGVNRMFAGIVGQSVEDEALATTFHSWVTGQMAANVQIIERAKARGEAGEEFSVEALATMIAAPLVYRLVWERRAPDRVLMDTLVLCLERAIHPENRTP
jgi:AcrR family transcriptional regulator